ncbi:hypothetical protein [Rothia nasisuis]|uniref:hypothetical protein n=1 Tax=Rothia nasisuis TaxID=2109647 RepID=UPI001F25657D|nr:hypothetical protein [Rothia nasisuis]
MRRKNFHLRYEAKYFHSDDNPEEWSEWSRIYPAVKPTLRESFFSPNSRLDKGILDIVHSLQAIAGDEYYEEQFIAGKRLLRSVVKKFIKPRKEDTHYQTMLTRGFGYQTEKPPAYDMIFEPEEIY